MPDISADSTIVKPTTFWRLLAQKNFGPLFGTQFLGAVCDNVFKAALLIYLARHGAEATGAQVGQLLSLAGGLFILPFLLFSATAGQLADHTERARLTTRIKLWEIALMVAAAGFFLMTPNLSGTIALLVLIFLMGVQSSFFGPIKYSLIPALLPARDVVNATALVGSSTFIAILFGTIMGSLFIAFSESLVLSLTLIAIAVCGWLCSLMIPPAPVAKPTKTSPALLNPYRAIVEVIRQTHRQPRLLRCILGISWFWAIGAVMLTQLPHYAHHHLEQGEYTTTLLLTVLLIGIGVGMIVYAMSNKSKVRLSLLTPALITMAISLLLFGVVSYFWQVGDCRSVCADDLATFFHLPAQAVGLLLATALIAISGGVFVVPLYATIQLTSDKEHVSRMIASNNIFNALFIVASAIVSGLLYALGISVANLIAACGLFALAYLGLRPRTHSPR